MKTKVLFVCLGNICRSPLGEGVFSHLVDSKGLSESFDIDSAGTSAYHIGERADRRMRSVAESHGVELNSLGRQVNKADFDQFDYIIAMDSNNFDDLLANCPVDKQYKITMMRDYDDNPGDGNVPDPYYGGIDGFEEVYSIVYRSSEELLNKICDEKGI